MVSGAGPDVIVTVGPAVSTVKLRESLPWLPAASVTRTVNLCAPSASEAVVNGDVHAANAPSSTAHSITVGLPAVVNVKLGVLSLVGPFGPPVIVTVGAV